MSDPTLWNYGNDVNKAFGDIPAAYTALTDLGTDYMFRGFMVLSTLDEPVLLEFTNPLTGGGASEILIPQNTVSPASGFEFTPDVFLHNGIIRFKYAVTPPTEGYLKVFSWRGENV